MLITFDFFLRGAIILGAVIVGFSSMRGIIHYRKLNENRETIKYYKTWLQEIPIYADYISSVLIGLSLFRVGCFLQVMQSGEMEMIFFNYLLMDNTGVLMYQHIIVFVGCMGALIYVAFSILQVISYHRLGPNFSLHIDIKKGNTLVTDGVYATIRHPVYLSQIILPLSASLTLFSWSVFLWTIFVIAPLFILRAKKEDELLEHYYGDKFTAYRMRVGGFFPYYKR